MDILAGQPARPTTPVPGVWLVDAPPTIQVRVYAVVTKFDPAAAASLADTAGAGSGQAPVTSTGGGGDDAAAADDAAPHPPLIPTPPGVLDRLRADPLERAWHALNARADEPALSLLSRPCAVVRPPADGRRRQLWVFGQDPDLALAGVDGLIEVERPAPIVVAKTVVCKEHGSKLSCLAAANGNTDPTSGTAGDGAKTPCSPTFAPPPAWTLLEAAAGEALAWTQGVRLSLLSERPVYDVTLRPTPGGQLVLCARPRAALHCLPREGQRAPLRAGVEPLVLRPLLLPALLVSPHMANGAQDARLTAAFDAALGPGWKAGRREARITAQASGASLPDWSIYFVPLVAGNIKALPAALAARWRGTHGVLTVWPTHLARGLAPPSRVVPPRPPRRGGDALGQPADLLMAAAGLFDFFTAYEPPAEDEGDGEAEGDGDADADVEPEPERTTVPDGTGDVDMEAYDDASDVDDLFESHSSPEPEPDDVPAPSEGGDLFIGSAFTSPRAGSALELDVNDLFGSSDAGTAPPSAVPRHNSATPIPEFARRSIPVSRQQSAAPMSRVTSEFGEDRPFVTEDDFNFFDSPPNPNPDLPVPPTGAEAKSDFSPSDWPDIIDARDESAPAGRDVVMADADKQGGPPDTTAEPIAVDQDDTPKSADAPPDTNVVPRDTAPGDATAEPPRKRAKIYIDVVPPAFAPLELPRRSRPRFRYGLPSPAAVSPLSLRTDLVERLQQQQQQSGKKASYDYTAGWELDSSTSDSEDDTPLTTGMPPTPASTADLDELPTRAPSVAPQPVVPDDEVEFDGTVCVGGEWVSLKDEPGPARSLARPWGPAWVELYHRHEMAISTPRPPDELPLDLDALLDAVVRNRFLRALFNDVPATVDDNAPSPSTLLKHGVALSEFAAASINTNGSNGLSGSASDSPDITKAGYTLPPTAVNVGFGGAIMSLSAAGLRYWRELGLSPAGGIKDLAAVAVCEPGDESARIARAFLRDMGEVYSAHHLGAHTVGDDEAAVDGIVTASSSALASTIARVRARATRPTVVYVITSATATADALAPLAARASPSSVVYAVPESAIHVTNLVPIAFEVYDLLPREVHRVMPRGRPLERAPAFLPYHAFTLSGDLTPRPELTMSWPPRSYDPFMRWRWVHAAYAWVPGVPPASRDGEAKPSPKDAKDSGKTASGVLLLATIDEVGDALDLRALRLDACTAADRVQRAWDVFAASATAVAFEWRLSITCLGVMPEDELGAWHALLAKRKDPVTLLMTEPTPPVRARPRTPVSNIPPAAFVDPAAAIVDESLAGSAVALAHRVAVEMPLTTETLHPPKDDSTPTPTSTTTLLPASSFLLSLATSNGTGATTAPYHVLFHRGARGAPLDPTAFAGEMHALAALGRRRWGLDGPAHLDAVSVGATVVRALARGGDERRADVLRGAVVAAVDDEAGEEGELKDGRDGKDDEQAKEEETKGKQEGKPKAGAGEKAGGKNGGGTKADGTEEAKSTPVKDEGKSPVKKAKSGAE